jgi:carboxyl-terminal processing protease
MHMPVPRNLLAAVLTLLVITVARGESATEKAQGDLSQVGDVGPAPSDVAQLMSLDLTEKEAARLFEEAMGTILEEYQGSEVSPADLYMGALVGMVDLLNEREASLANHPAALSRNAVMTASDAEYIDQMSLGRKTGIGIEFQANTAEGVLYITKVYPGSPADRSGGLRPGDLVVAIDGYALQRRDLSEILTLLRGDQGTPIGLSLRRPPAGYFNVVLTREEYELPTVDAQMLDSQMGMMRITQFHGRTGEEARAQLTDLLGLGAESIVLDLRGNQGGLLEAVRDVASLFLAEGTVLARIQDAQGRETDLVAEGSPLFSGSLVCLVNRWTSSGAELLTMALQESDRARIVGDTTEGKAITESLHTLAPGVHLRLSSTALLSPLGQSWHNLGLRPDFLVQGVTQLPPGGDAWSTNDVQLVFARELFMEPMP